MITSLVCISVFPNRADAFLRLRKKKKVPFKIRQQQAAGTHAAPSGSAVATSKCLLINKTYSIKA